MACHSEPYKWRIWNLCLEFYKSRRNPGLALVVMAEDEALPPQPRPPRQPPPPLHKLHQTVYHHLPRPFVSPAAIPAFRRPFFLSSEPQLPPPRDEAAPQRGRSDPASEEVMEAEGGGKAAAGKKRGGALGSFPHGLVSLRRPLPRLSLPLSPARRAGCPPAEPGHGARLTHRLPGRAGGAAGAILPLLWGARGGCSPPGTAAVKWRVLPGAGLSRSDRNAAKHKGFSRKTLLSRPRSWPLPCSQHPALRNRLGGHGPAPNPRTRQAQPEQAVDRALRGIPEHTGNFFQVFRLVQTWSREELAQWFLSGFGLAGVAGKGSLPNACFQCVFRALTAQVCDSGTFNGFRTTKEQKESCVKILQSLRLNLREHQQTEQKHGLTKESWFNRDKWNSKHTASSPQNNV